MILTASCGCEFDQEWHLMSPCDGYSFDVQLDGSGNRHVANAVASIFVAAAEAVTSARPRPDETFSQAVDRILRPGFSPLPPDDEEEDDDEEEKIRERRDQAIEWAFRILTISVQANHPLGGRGDPVDPMALVDVAIRIERYLRTGE